MSLIFFFFFNDTATTEIYTLSLHDALPIYPRCREGSRVLGRERRGRLARRPPAARLAAGPASAGPRRYRVPVQGSAPAAALPRSVCRRDAGVERHPPRRLGRAQIGRAHV